MDKIAVIFIISQMAKEQYPKFDYIDLKNKKVVIGKIKKDIDMSNLNSRLQAEEKNKKSKALDKDLRIIHAKKMQEVKDFISETSLDANKKEEYQTKRLLAEEAVANDDYSVFETDALLLSSLLNTPFTAEQYAMSILSKANAWIPKNNLAIIRMGTVRTYISALIVSKQFTKAKEILEKVSSADAETIVMATEAELLALLGL